MMSAPFTGAGGVTKPQPNLVLLSRSDGLKWTTEVINAELGSDPSKGQVSEPISEDLNQIPHEETRTKLLEWKEAIGNGLSQQLGWPKESPYLVTFPEHFCLRWHRTGASALEARMYGHPRGFTDDFVYKEPHDFVPHALWLLSESVDHKQCLCKPCHRATDRQIPRTFKERMDDQAAELDAVKITPANASESKPASKKGTKNTAGSKKKSPAATTGTPAVKSTAAPPKATKEPTTAAPKQKKVPIPRGPQTTNLATAPISTPASAPSGTSVLTLPPASAQTATTIPTPVAVAPPAAAPAAPHPALNDEPTLFRRGEMVWYQQETAWRIGIIRHVGDSYAVVPLGHALVNLPDVQKLAHQMRPFLTFSVPSMQIVSAETAFDQVQWQDLFNDPIYAAKGEMVALEASKLAAIEIDGSWSTFNQLPPGLKQPKNESSYGGVFLGAEMIRIGDPIRPKDKSRGRLLEVVEISVKATTSVPNPADPANTPPTTTYTLSFRGVEYEANIAPEQGRINAQPVGAIFQKDTAFRTAAARAGGAKQKCVWVIKSWDTVWLEPEVGGRSYVTDELMNVTQGPQAVETAKHTGQFAEASAYLNNRMQNPVSRDLGRRVNRRETVGAAIAPTQPLIFGDGLFEQ